MSKECQLEHAVPDYHNWTHRGTPKDKRDKLNIGDIYVNAIECHNCGWFVRSRNTHDYRACNCHPDSGMKVFVDGGSWYAKRNYGKNAKYTSVIEMYTDA